MGETAQVDHPLLWTEQMMPVLPLTRVPSADAAIDLAVVGIVDDLHVPAAEQVTP